MKTFFRKSQNIKLCVKIHEVLIDKIVTQNVVVYVEKNIDIQWFTKAIQSLISKNSKIVILLMLANDQDFNQIYENFKVEIDQMIYFYKMSSEEIFETYFINNKHIKRKLGDVNSNNFLWEKDIQTSFIKRRSNFHGLELKGMVEFSGYSMNANLSYLGKDFKGKKCLIKLESIHYM